ncbi:DMT family transporter [Candidatus Avelusimicrobium luingense]|uniref:DMT family transporter n=1 Tax=Candidatus Avelusimicrobium luingense TaxID=3416211 RepID=UPI003D0B32F6
MSYVLAFCLALCWGTAYLATKNMVEVLSPCWGTFFQVVAGLIFFLFFFRFRREHFQYPVRELWRPALISFLLILLPFAARAWALQYTAPTVAGIFNGTSPIWSFIAGAILLKGVDRFTWRRAAGVLMGLAGMIVIMYPQLRASTPENMMELLGCGALLIMAVSYGLANVLTKKIMVDKTSISWQANTQYQYIFAAILLLLVALITEPLPHLTDFTPKVIISIVCAGVFSSAIAFLLMVALIKRWGATRMASVTYIVPIVAMGTDIIFRGRIPHTTELIGLSLLFISLWLIQKKVDAK